MSWEERYHPLRDEWVVIAGHRDQRPWQGENVRPSDVPRPTYDPTCYLCPSNPRVSGAQNEPYTGVFVFDNDHPCVGPAAPEVLEPPVGIFRNRPARGLSRVVCYSPDHSKSLAELPLSAVLRLVETWRDQVVELSRLPDVRHVLVFENKGEVVGVSNPHPHGQIYATNFVFKTMEIEASACRRHFAAHGRTLLSEIIASELEDGRRILVDEPDTVSFVPYFARYPYETYVAPKAAHLSLATMSEAELASFSRVLHATLIRFDNLWRMSFPYVLVLHHAPCDGEDHRGWHFHVQLHPPLRSPTLRKYLAGPELGGGCFLNDRSPEVAAAQLRAVPASHYLASLGTEPTP